MAYTKTIWVNDDTEVSAENMNHIENGIADSYNVPLLAVSDTAPSECSEGDKYYNTETGLIYTAIDTDTWGTVGEEPIEDILYVVFSEKNTYAWNGTDMLSVGGGSGSEIVIGDEEPTEDTKMIIDTDAFDPQYSDITDEYSEANNKAYSCNYLNNCETYSTTEVKTNKVYVDENDKKWPIYRVAGTKTLGAAWSTLATNVKRPTFVDIFLTVGNSNDIRPYTYIPTCEFVVSGGNFWVRDTNTGSSAYGKSFYYTVEYTKTTD